MNTKDDDECPERAYVQNPFTQFFLYLLIGWVAFLALMLMLLCTILLIIAVAALPIIANEICKEEEEKPLVDPDVPPFREPTLSPVTKPTTTGRRRARPPGLHPRSRPRPHDKPRQPPKHQTRRPHGPGPHRPRPHGPGPHGSGPHGSGPHGSGPHRPGPHRPGPHGPDPHRPGPYRPGPRRPHAHLTPTPGITKRSKKHPKHKLSKPPKIAEIAPTTPMGFVPRRFPRPKPSATTSVPKVEIRLPVPTPKAEQPIVVALTKLPPLTVRITKLPKSPTQQEKPTWIHLPIFPIDNQTASNKEKRFANESHLVDEQTFARSRIVTLEKVIAPKSLSFPNITTMILRAPNRKRRRPVIKAVLTELPRERGPFAALRLVMDGDNDWLQSKPLKKSAIVIQNVVQVNGSNVTIELKLKKEIRRDRVQCERIAFPNDTALASDLNESCGDCKNNADDTFCFN